jgi:hypothetical protein
VANSFNDGRTAVPLEPEQAQGDDLVPIGRAPSGAWAKVATFLKHLLIGSGGTPANQPLSGMPEGSGVLMLDPETGKAYLLDPSEVGGGGGVWGSITGTINDQSDLQGVFDTLGTDISDLQDNDVTLAAAIAAKANTASPAFTGTPTAPTQSPADNSTKLATTAYADAAAAAVTSTAVLRPDPALDLALADQFLDTGADLQADDLVLVSDSSGTLRRVRGDAAYSRIKTLGGDDLLDLDPAMLFWPDIGLWYTSSTLATLTSSQNPTQSFPYQDNDVGGWLDSSRNRRHLTNTITSPGKVTVDFTDTGLPAVRTDPANTTLTAEGLSGVLNSKWTVVLCMSRDAAGDATQIQWSAGQAGNDDYIYLTMRRNDTGGLTGSNITHRFGGSVSGGWSSFNDDSNIADPGPGPVVFAFGRDGTNFWLLKQDGTGLLTSAGAAFNPDCMGWGLRRRNTSNTGAISSGHNVALAAFPYNLSSAQRTRVVNEFKRRFQAAARLNDRVTFMSAFGGAVGSKSRRNRKPLSSIAATVGTVGVAAPAANGSGPGADVSGGAALKVGRATYGKFGGWPARGSFFAEFHVKIDTLPVSGDAHLIGQWAQAGRTWRAVLTSAGSVRFDMMTVPASVTVQSLTDVAGLSAGDELRGVVQWDRDAQLMRLNVNTRTQVTQAYSGPNWSITNAEPTNAVTVGAGWSGSGTNDYDAAFDGKVYHSHAGRGKLSATELALFLQAGGYETVRLPGPVLQVTNFQGGHGHVRWGGSGSPTANVTIEGVYTLPASGGAIKYSLNGAAPVTGVGSPSGRTFSFTVNSVPAGRNTIELFFAGQPSVRTVVRVNVGPVVLVCGQSLAPNVSVYPQRYDGADGHVLYLDQSRRWRQAGTMEITPSYQDYQDVSSLSAGYSSWARIAARESARLGVPVAVVIASQSGSGSTAWLPATNHHDDTTLYGQSLRLAEMAGGADLVWWDQGHNDAAFGIGTSAYETNLNAIVNAYFADLGCPTAVVVMPETTASYSANVAGIQTAQRNVIAGNTHARQGSDEDGLTPNSVTGDGVHWGSSTDGQIAQSEIDARVERHVAALDLVL